MSSGNVTLMSYVLLRDRITTKLFIDCAQMLNNRGIVRPSAAPLLVLPGKKRSRGKHGGLLGKFIHMWEKPKCRLSMKHLCVCAVHQEEQIH